MTKVYQALQNYLENFVPVASIAKENIKFKPVVGKRYYRTTFLPGEPYAAAIGSDAANRHGGLFQIDIFEPSGAGVITGKTEADRIVSKFKRGTVILTIDLTIRIEKAWVLPVNEESDWCQIPVRVHWRSDIEN